MAHYSSDKGGFVPHSIEAARAKQLLPLYIREVAATSSDNTTDVSLIGLLEDYYKYLTSQGSVTALEVVDPGLDFAAALDSPVSSSVTGGSGDHLEVYYESSTDSPAVFGRIVNVYPKNCG